MDNSWLPTDEDLSSYKEESKDEIIERLSRTVDYLMGEHDDIQVKREYAKEKKASEAKKKPKQLKDTSGFTKVHKMINQKAVRGNMFSSSEKQMLFDLIPFCNLESNVITDEDGIPMTQKDIIELIGWSKAHVIEVMNGLLDKDVLSKVVRGKSVFYKVNKEWYGN